MQNNSIKKVISFVLVCVSTVSVVSMYAKRCNEITNCSDIGQCFTSVTSRNNLDIIGVPPDTMGSVGPEQYVVLINNGAYSFNKKAGQADGILQADLNSFFNVEINTGIFDTRIKYDHFTKRWVGICVDGDDPTGGKVYMAISDTHLSDGVITPCTHWLTLSFFQNQILDSDGRMGTYNVFLDFPTLGIDQHAIYIGGNTGTRVGDSLTGASPLFVIQKDALYNRSQLKAIAFRDARLANSVFTPWAADNESTKDLGFGVVIATQSDGFIGVLDTLLFYRVLNPGFKGGKNPTLEGPIEIKIPEYAFLFNAAPQKGSLGQGIESSLRVSFSDLADAHIIVPDDHDVGSNDFRLFTCHTIGINKDGGASNVDRLGVRWYEIKNLDSDPVVQTVSTIYDSAEENPRFYYMPSMMSNKRGDVLVGCSTSAVDEFIDAVCFRRFKGDPQGEPILNGFSNALMRDPIFLTDSSTSYNFQFNPDQGQRWGDYSKVSLDHDNDMTLWTIQEFCADTDIWGLKIAELRAPRNIPPFPLACN